MLKRFVFILFLCFSHLFVVGQNLSDDIKKMFQCYHDANTLEIKMKVVMTGTPAFGKGNEITEASLCKDGTNYYTSVNGITTLVNDRCVLMINNNTKTMVLDDRRKKSKENNEASAFLPDQLDSILSHYDKVKYNGIVGNNKIYEIQSKGIITSTSLYLDKDDHHISKVIYYYNTEYSELSKVEIRYEVFKKNTELNPSHFDEKKYIQKGDKGGWKVTASYKEYDLLNTNN